VAISVDWPAQVIHVPQADLTDLGGGVYELDLNAFRLSLKALEASELGMPWPDTHSHNTAVTLAGTVIARVVEIINGYTVEFEDGQYAVNLTGANSNVAEVAVVNQVSIRSFNSAGLIEANPAISSTMETRIREIHALEGLGDDALEVDTDAGTRKSGSLEQTITREGNRTTIERV